MCGIAGFILPQLRMPPGRLAQGMLDRLEHRGPDDHGWLSYGRAGVDRGRGPLGVPEAEAVLLHRRLSILDLTESGWQPMSTPDGRYHIVFNGEIYNYVELRAELEALGTPFRSQSDTEVLLAAYAEWGPAALTRLVGMFAFAILDTRDRKLFLARDFFGIKPLHYALCHGGMGFASELKALLTIPGLAPEVAPDRLYHYLRFGRSGVGGQTLFTGMFQLPAAHYMEVSLEAPTEARPVRYWRVDLAQRIEVSFDEAAARVRELFLENVRLHLRSDVPVGAALSGGIDSSAIVLAMRHLQGNQLDLHTFSYVADDDALSEERWADLAGQAAGAQMHKVRLGPERLVEDLDQLIFMQDEPFGSTSIYAQNQVFRLAREAGVTVMLDGQGADELLGGYPIYVAARLASLLRHGQWSETVAFARQVAAQPDVGPAWLLLRAAGMLLPDSLQGPSRHLVGEARYPSWMNAGWFASQGVAIESPARTRRPELLREQLLQTLEESSLPGLLHYEDRNSMAFSIESRVPFLTPALVSYLFSLPEHYLIAPDGTRKAVFRAAMRGIVPDAILDRKDKIGFLTPEKRWLSALHPWVEGVLRSDAAHQIPALNLPVVEREWRSVLSGQRPFDARLWRWVNLIRWTERFNVRFS